MGDYVKFLVVGLGSMGKRRIRCLKALNVEAVAGFDPRQDRCDEAAEKYDVKTFSSFDEALKMNPDAFVISTPPDLHMRYAKIAVERGKHFFCEASVTDDGMADIITQLEKGDVIGAPSCTMRFHAAVKMIKEHVDRRTIGDILAFTAHTGQWLPDWHPWEDYRSYYVSKRATGACREIVPFELTWLTWLVGEVSQVSAMRDKVSDLDCDIDDVYQLLLRTKSGVYGHLLVDVLARYPVRSLRLIGREGTIEWSAETKTVRIYSASTGEWSVAKEPEPKVEAGYSHLSPELMYIDEMRAFADACAGTAPYPYSMTQDHRLLEVLYAAERSSDGGQAQKLA
jgi:predicted dehydrogenase